MICRINAKHMLCYVHNIEWIICRLFTISCHTAYAITWWGLTESMSHRLFRSQISGGCHVWACICASLGIENSVIFLDAVAFAGDDLSALRWIWFLTDFQTILFCVFKLFCCIRFRWACTTRVVYLHLCILFDYHRNANDSCLELINLIWQSS